MNKLIIGSKFYNYKNINSIIDSFEKNMRFNFAIPNNNNGTIYDEIILNCHTHESLSRPIDVNLKKYSKYKMSEEIMISFYDNIEKYTKIIKQPFTNFNEINIFLTKIECNLKLIKLPRSGNARYYERSYE